MKRKGRPRGGWYVGVGVGWWGRRGEGGTQSYVQPFQKRHFSECGGGGEGEEEVPTMFTVLKLIPHSWRILLQLHPSLSNTRPHYPLPNSHPTLKKCKWVYILRQSHSKYTKIKAIFPDGWKSPVFSKGLWPVSQTMLTTKQCKHIGNRQCFFHTVP